MTDKISKELAKLSVKEKTIVAEILNQLKTDDTTGLQITKLQGHADIFRVRKGRLRIIYQIKSRQIKILVIERRSEKTYRNF